MKQQNDVNFSSAIFYVIIAMAISPVLSESGPFTYIIKKYAFHNNTKGTM